LAVIVTMLRTDPQRRRKSTADNTTGGRDPRTHYSAGTPPWPRARASEGLIGEAYGRFLALPVPVVLVGLWLLGAMLLGLVVSVLIVVAYYSADALTMLLAAIAQA
jgi:hypothetical protein